jgi:hypothetical protein
MSTDRDALRRAIIGRLSPWGALRAELSAMAGGAGAAAAWGVVVGNLILLGWAWQNGWGLADLLWPYWWQSVLIGIYTVLRMVSLERARTEGLVIPAGYDPQQVVRGAKWIFAGFFAIHYGMFHLVYLMFIGAMPGNGTGMGWAGWLVAFVVLVGSQHLSFRDQRRRDAATAPNLVALMMLPYARILPMHLIAVFGAFLMGGTAAMLLFGLLKTCADLAGLGYEQRIADALAEAAALESKS